MLRGFKRTLGSLAWLAAGAVPAAAQYLPLPHQAGAPGLGLALRRLPVAARALYVTAHPDDEHNGVLVALSRGRGFATALLTLTRGEGGQNAIGPELFEALGVLRTEELAAVHRYDGVRQYFSQAFEFGFSVSLEETLARWGHEATLGDVVRVVRGFRPDVILTLPLEAPGHQHHTAAAQLAREAFRAAADPARFPEQLAEGLRPWQARKLYQGGTGTGAGARLAGRTVPLALGARDPLLGASWMEFGSLARSFHKSQATRQLRSDPGEFDLAGYRLVDAEPAASASESDIFDGIDTSLAGLARFAPDVSRVRLAQGLAEVQASAQRAQAQLDWRKPENVVPELREGLARLRELRASLSGLGLSPEARLELDERLAPVEAAFMQALALAHGLAFRVTSDDGEVTPGQSFRVTAQAWNQGSAPLVVDGVSLALPEGWTSRLVSGGSGELAAGQGLEQVHEVTVAPGARLSRPYWRRAAGADRYELEGPSERGLPWSAPPAMGRLRFSSGGVAASWDEPAVFRYPGRWVGGEKQKTVNVVPELSVRLTPDLLLFPTGAVPATRELRVTLLNNRKRASTVDVSLVVPAGWQIVPRQAPLRLTAEGEEGGLRFAVTPPGELAPGAFAVRAEAVSEGRTFREGYRMVAYDHIEERPFYAGASSAARVLDVRVAPAARIGYVTGTGDEVPGAIEQLGVPIALLSGDDLAFGDLGGYSTIVLGVRAYQARADLRASHQRLMAYASEGGHLIVQYHQAAEFNPTGDGPSPYAPFPARVGTGRVTDETAPVRILDPESPVFRTPNRITEEDWQGWVQERGLLFLEARDARYRELLSSADPFPANAGARKGLLVEARLGKGTWTYVGLALFRQLAAGTPGAYRLLANLLSRPRGQ